MFDFLLRLLVLVAAVTQIVVPSFVNPFAEGGQGLGVTVPSQIEPAGYAFAIWGPIYLLALVYAGWQLTPAGRRDPVTANIAPLVIVLYAGSSFWLAAAKFGPVWATMPILAVMAVSASAALAIVMRADGGSLGRTLAAALPFGLYAGWTACATFVNVAEVAPQLGFDSFGLSVPQYGVASIIAAAIVAGGVLWVTRGALGFAAAVIWALAAIIVAAQTRGYDESIVLASAAGIAVASVVTIATKLRERGRTHATE